MKFLHQSTRHEPTEPPGKHALFLHLRYRFPLSVKTQVEKNGTQIEKSARDLPLQSKPPESIPTKKGRRRRNLPHRLPNWKFALTPKTSHYSCPPRYTSPFPHRSQIQKAAISGLIDEIVVHSTAALEIQCSFSNL